jgi:hypothetical protein
MTATARKVVRVSIPIKTSNPLNNSQGFSKWATFGRAKERREQRSITALVVGAALRSNWIGLPCVITLTRVAPSNGLDDDAIGPALKSVRDGITDALGLKNDRDPLLVWAYAQRRGAQKQYAVEVEIQQGGRA